VIGFEEDGSIMRSIVGLSYRLWVGISLASVLVALLSGCATVKSAQESPGRVESRFEKEADRTRFAVPRGEDVVGQLAVVRLQKGDTLPDVARHFSLGTNAVSDANPRVDLWLPRDGELVVLPLSFILPDAPRRGIVINVATMRLFSYKGDGNSASVTTYPIGVGTSERPTPTGQMYVARKAKLPTWHVPASIADDHRKKGDPLPAEVPPGPDNPLGERALYLSKASYLIHGTNKPASIGLNATNGCMRLYPENVTTLYDDTALHTPVVIVDQPYLLGQRDGVLYLEAHKSPRPSAARELENLYARLRNIEKRSARPLDWKKVKSAVVEARGIPVPILEMTPRSGRAEDPPVEVAHPDKLFGRPEIPELKLDAWYVLAANREDETDARRLAAIINHQGPPIPARVVSSSNRHRVLAGPFDRVDEAKEVIRRLKIDLEIDGILVEPAAGK